MTEDPIYGVHVSPGNAETLVSKGRISKSPFASIFFQQHLSKITKIGWCALKL